MKPLLNLSLVVVAVSYGVLLSLALRAGILGVPLGLLVLLSIWRYCYAVLRTVAQGHDEVPPPSIESMNPVAEGGLIAHFVLFPGLVLWLLATSLIPAGSAGLLLRAGGIAVLALVFPASAALIGLTGNLGYALDPRHIGALLRQTGRHYLLLLLVWAALASAAVVLQRALRSPNVLAQLLADALLIWCLFAAFAAAGRLLHTHRDEFEIPGEPPATDEVARQRLEAARESALDRAYASISSGLVEAGYQILREQLSDEHDSVDANRWLFESMLRWSDKTHALKIAGRYIERLAKAGANYEALEVFRRCRRIEASFALPPTEAEALASYARSIGREGLADELRAAAAQPPGGPPR